MDTAALTGPGNWFEDCEPGTVIRHIRGKTVGALENVGFTNLLMNTADGHFYEDLMKDSPLGTIIVFGGVTAALVIGRAALDTAENVIAELAMDKLKLPFPVKHGDTLYALSEVVERRDADRFDAGIVRFRHWGVNQDDRIVFQCVREVLMKRGPTN